MRFDKRELECMIDTADVYEGYSYWFDKLLAYCLNIFDYENLPDSLPKKEIESNLILTGHCVIFEKNNELVTVLTSPTGFDKYYNPRFTAYSQPRLGCGTLYFQNSNKQDSVIVYNCDLQNSVLGMDTDGSLYGYIGRYARLLSDIESTISNRLVNIRDTYIPVADNENVKTSIKSFIRNRILGKRSIVTDSSIVPNLKSIDISEKSGTDKIYDLLVSRDKILECFYREIGVKFYQPKKAQVNEEEVTANTQMLVISLDDLLKEREQGFEEVNKYFKTNIKVKLNEKFINNDYKESEVKENATI